MASDLWQGNVPDDGREPPVIDTSVPHVARVYDYWLDGKNNYAVDRETGDEAIHGYPDMRSSERPNRAFLKRSVRYLAEEAGIRQFLDVGTGCRQRATPMRSPRRRPRSHGSSTSTTTASSLVVHTGSERARP